LVVVVVVAFVSCLWLVAQAVADSPPQIFIDEVRADGARCECLRVSVEGALNLAADLLKLVDVIKGWTNT